MARKPDSSTVGEPQVTASVAIGLLRKQIDKAHDLLGSRPLTRDARDQWELVTRNYLEKAFGVGSANVSSVMDVGKFGVFSMDSTESDWERERAADMETQISRLDGLVELLVTEEQLQGGTAAELHVPKRHGRRVFLVHGHDEAALNAVARFLQLLELEVVILREQPNLGRTIIEKFEDYTDVGFAVVLLTGDDRGGPVAAAPEDQSPRARQNVILEFGYFIGRLGRNRTCALYVDGVEIPSDYSGVLYVKLDDAEGWRFHLARELKAAGLPVDMNKAL